jgi:hypothetical protein
MIREQNEEYGGKTGKNSKIDNISAFNGMRVKHAK